MITDSTGVPADLKERSEERLGRYLPSVDALVERVNRIPWLARVGETEVWDAEVVRVANFEEAKRLDRESAPFLDSVWRYIEEIGKSLGRLGVMEAAAEYAIACFNYSGERVDYYDSISDPANFDIEGAVRETILDDVVPLYFFRDAIHWYELGHWRCGFTKRGEKIIY